MSLHRIGLFGGPRLALRLSPGLVLGLLTACAAEPILDFQSQTDEWAQASDNRVDILWVIDDSTSMAEEQQTLERGFASFAEVLDASSTDFHLGVITTSFDPQDEERGVLRGDPPFLTSDSYDYADLFVDVASVGIDGSDKEKGLEAALHALDPSMVEDGPNRGFLRDEAQLLVIFVSDEDDCSDGGALEGQAAAACYTASDRLTPISRLVADFRDLKDGDVDRVQLSAIVGHPGGLCPDVYPGNRYLQASALTGGVAGDICQPDWRETLAALGLEASGMRRKFRLSRAAQPDTLEVRVDDQLVPQGNLGGWTYDSATWFLEFHGEAIPHRGARVSATYLVDPTQIAPGTATATVAATASY